MKSNKLILAPIVLILLIAVAIAMLGVSASLPVAHAEEPADADGDGVFDANTAEYTFETYNRSEDYFPWIYDRETNVWSNGDWNWSNGGNFFESQLRLTVTKGGTLAVEFTYFNFGGSFEVYRRWGQGQDDYEDYVWNEEPFDEYPHTERLSFSVNTGDFVGFWLANYGYSEMQIKGLKKPQQEFTETNISFTATANEGGTVSWKTQNDKTVSGEFNYCDKDVLTAIPQDGYYFNYWTDSTGHIASREQELVPYR